MAADIEGIHMREATQVNTGSGVQREGKALLVDCDAVHMESEAVNKFITDGGGSDRN